MGSTKVRIMRGELAKMHRGTEQLSGTNGRLTAMHRKVMLENEQPKVRVSELERALRYHENPHRSETCKVKFGTSRLFCSRSETGC